VEYGGLGLSPFAIGTALAIFGIINSILQARFLGPLMRRFGPQKLYRIVILSPCATFMIYPVMKYAAQRSGGNVDGFVIACISIHLASGAPVYMAYGTPSIVERYHRC
jgi:Na+/melibiose symporter-like transporter